MNKWYSLVNKSSIERTFEKHNIMIRKNTTSIIIMAFLFVFFVSCRANQTQQESATKKFIPDSSAFEPIYLGEPPANAGTSLINYPDGTIKLYFRKGDWDQGGFSPSVYSISTTDEGRTWSEPVELVNTGEHCAQSFITLSPVSGEIILFYRLKRETWMVRSKSSQTDWTDNKKFDDYQFAGICYANCLWVDMQDNKKRVICGFHQSDGKGAGSYYSDDDGMTWHRSNRTCVPNLIPNIWHTGAVEPTFVELKDGRIWMLMRNSNDHLWEAYSTDKGATWSEAKPSRFYCGPNSWVTLKRLSDGQILLLWNNAMSMDPQATQDKWSFTNREVLHGAISNDEGKTWNGFREILLDRMRNSSNFVNHPGDKGINESKVAETKEGNVLIACGQAPGHRSFVLLDPDWLYQTSRYDDFSKGLKNWATHKLLVRPPIYNRLYHHNYNRKKGAVLVDNPNIEGKKVLHVRRPEDPTVYSQRDGAVWNFPASFSGEFETRIMLKDKFRGSLIALNDRYFQPTDNQSENTAMFTLNIPSSGKINSTTTLEKGTWYTIKLKWNGVQNSETDSCEVYINGILRPEKLPLMNKSINGISYVRFRSTSLRPDNDGFYVEYVKADVESIRD